MPCYLKRRPNTIGEIAFHLLQFMFPTTQTLADHILNIPRQFRPEIEILICCARTHLEIPTAQRLCQLAQRELDWAYLEQAAFEHGVLPLVYWNLNTTCPELVPRQVLESLHADFSAITRRNLFFTSELLQILHLLEEHNIPVVPLKGPILAATVYGDLAFRQFSDLDIMVREENVTLASQLLVDSGYERIELDTDASRLDHEPYHWGFESPHGTLIELHWRAPAHWRIKTGRAFFPQSPDKTWGTVKRIPLNGQAVSTFQPEETLLMLSLHGTKHGWRCLNWICDIAEIIQAYPNIEWDYLFEEAEKLGSKRMVNLALLLANELLDAQIPSKIAHHFTEDPTLKALAQQVYAWISAEDDSSTLIDEIRFYVMIRERWQDRLPYYWHYLIVYLHTIFTPNQKDRTFFPLPESLHALYYFTRPIRIMWDYLLHPLKNRISRLINRQT